jgi:hypothetical protein
MSGKLRPFRLSTYVVQPSPDSRCPMCNQYLQLLCDRKGNIRKPWFYICWSCRNITQVGIGPVEEEQGWCTPVCAKMCTVSLTTVEMGGPTTT